MMVYQIHRLRESARQQFRWAPHIAGVSIVKSRDYEPASTIEAASPYAAWLILREGEEALQIGDVLESPAGDLRIFKYIGFEEARWFVADAPPTEGAAFPRGDTLCSVGGRVRTGDRDVPDALPGAIEVA